MTIVLEPVRVAALVAAASGLATGFAFILQHGFGLAPCTLCVWERWPYAVAIVVLTLGLATGRPRAGLAIAAAALAANVGLSAWHVAIEQGWAPLPATCGADVMPDSIEALRAQLAAAPARCDEVTAAFLGLSLAAWNGLLAAGLAVVSAAAAARSGSARPS